MSRLTSARGLVTSSSEIARADGALSVADNVTIDYENVIQQRRGYKEYSPLLPSVAKQVFTYKSKVLNHHGTSLSFDSSTAGTFIDFPGTYTELAPGLRIKSLEANGNFYFTTYDGVKVISVKSSSDFPTATIKTSGAVEASDLTGMVIPDSSGFLPAQSKVAYRMLFGYKDANSNLHPGSPSARVVLTNLSQDTKLSEIFTVNILNYTLILNQQYFTFNTLDSGYFAWFKKTPGSVAPINADTLDKEGIEIDISDPAITYTNNIVAAVLANTLSSQVTGITIELNSAEVQVTIINAGDSTDASQGNLSALAATVTKVFDGSITTGTPSKISLNFILPAEVDESYYYQIYRTANATVTAGVSLNDIDPGDEHNFVFEAPITAADVLAGEITVEDNTPEAFRAVGAYLYTNAVTGEGISQANGRPPICKDISTFRNSAFYANTKDYHTLQISILSIDNFVSGSTKFSIGRGASASEYTFVGEVEVTDITVVAASATTESSYITLNSANNQRQYYIWFDKGAGVDPLLTGKLGIRVPLELYPDTVAGSKEAILASLLEIPDFDAVDFSTSVVRVSCVDSGTVTDPTHSAPVSGWTFNVVTQGDGEDDIAKEVLLSQSSSIGVAIDLTARSLVRVINKDADSPVTANYLSGLDDLPGKILLKAKTLEDVQFSVAISDAALSSEFSPEVPQNVGLDSINSTTNVFTTTITHNLTIGQQIYINDNPGGTPVEFSGVYTVLTTPSPTTFTTSSDVGINQPGPLSGFVFKTTAVSDNNATPNRVYFSKINQPEAVPSVNYIDVGSKDKHILRILGLRDNLVCLKEDGIYIITGQGAAPGVLSPFTTRLIDNSAILTAPDTAVVLNNLIFCLSTQGIVSISDSGVSIVARNIEDQVKKVTTFAYNYKTASFGVSYESDRAYLIWLPTNKADTVATQCYRYSTITNTWTRWTMSNTCGIVNYLGDDRMYLGGAGRNYILQERKNNERQDAADRDFTRQIGTTSVSDTKITLSTVQDITAGDVITQDQYLTVPKFNRMLKKLDSDSGPALSTYVANFSSTQGSNLANILLALVVQLNSDANLFGAFTTPSGLNTKEALQTDYNLLISEMNGSTSGTTFKDYKQVTDLIIYEVEILEVNSLGNRVNVDRATWFIQGDVQVFKAITTEVEYAPQHFGKPEEFKQITEGTIIFDQGTISNATIGYASDRSLNFVDIAFKLDGPGFWACFPWSAIPWGGSSNERGQRTLIPQNKARCRYLHVRFKHSVARQQYKLLGISLEPRAFSTKAYR